MAGYIGNLKLTMLNPAAQELRSNYLTGYLTG